MNTENIHGEEVNIKMPSKKDVLNSTFLVLSASTLLLAILLVITIITTKINIVLILLTILILFSGFISAIVPYKNVAKLGQSKKVIDSILFAFWIMGIIIGLFVLSTIIISLLNRIGF